MADQAAANPKNLFNHFEFFFPRFFLLFAFLLAFFSPMSAVMRTFSIIFLSILFEALAFMLLGSLAGGFIEEFVSRDRVTSLLPSGSRKSVFMAAAIGFILPVCECAIVPVVRRLLRKGVPFSAAIAYLLAGPIVNPIVALSTAVAYFYNWKIVFFRLALGYVAAVIIGFLVDFLVKENERLAPVKALPDGVKIAGIASADLTGASVLKTQAAHPCSIDHEHDHACCGHDHSSAGSGNDKSGVLNRVLRAFRHGADDFLEVACFLVIGAFFASAAQTFLDRQSVVSLLSESWLAIAVMIVLAIALNLCSEADAFVAASFKNLVGIPGQMAFMVLGPMFDIKLFFMYFSIFSRKTAITLAVTTILVVYLLTLLSAPLMSGGVI